MPGEILEALQTHVSLADHLQLLQTLCVCANNATKKASTPWWTPPSLHSHHFPSYSATKQKEGENIFSFFLFFF